MQEHFFYKYDEANKDYCYCCCFVVVVAGMYSIILIITLQYDVPECKHKQISVCLSIVKLIYAWHTSVL